MREKRLSVTELEDRFQLFKDEVIKSGKYNEKEHSDNMLHRFLRARKSDVPKALTMFSNYIQWRHDAEVDDIVQNYSFPEAAKVSEMYPRFYHKTDKLGRPVYFEILGKMHVEALFSVTSTERLIKGYIREYEKLLNYRFAACGLKIGKHIEQGCSVLDLKGVPLSQFNQVRKVVQQVSSVAQDYYPETLGKMFIINAPFLFKGIWQIVKPMLDENTVSKISVLGSNYESELFEVIDKSNVPVEFGGTCSCQGGCSKSDIGPWNDQSVPGYPIAFYEDFKKRDVTNISECPKVNHGLIVSRKHYQRALQLTVKSSQSPPIIESIHDLTTDTFPVTSTYETMELITSVDNYCKIERNVTARSKRRINIVKDLLDKDLHDLQEDTKEVLLVLEDSQMQFEKDSEEILGPKNDQRQITSLVANAAKPFFTSEMLIKLYQFMDQLNKFEKYAFQTRLDTALVKYSQSAALAKISKLLHIMYEVKRHRSES